MAPLTVGRQNTSSEHQRYSADNSTQNYVGVIKRAMNEENT
mgnify:CR=1 FL=1